MADANYSENGDGQFKDTTEGYAQQSLEGQADVGTADSGGQTPGDKINASKNDDDDRKIFVGGLSWETTVKDLKEYFSKFGDVADCTLKTDLTTGRSRGFGFVLFSDTQSVEKVVTVKEHFLHGRNIDPKRAKARGGREPIKKVFVGGLDPDVPEAMIREHFATFGKIEEIDLPYDKMKNQRRAFCFITFESEEVVDRVCEAGKQKIGVKEVDVKKATPKNDRFGEGFGGRGGRGGFGGRGGRGGRGGEGAYSQGNGWGNQGYDYNSYYGQGYGNYDYSGYGNYGGYDYNNYYNQGWGGYGNGSGYGSQGNYGSGYGSGSSGYGGQGYDYSGWYSDAQGGTSTGQQSNYKAKGRGAGSSGSYHPYQR